MAISSVQAAMSALRSGVLRAKAFVMAQARAVVVATIAANAPRSGVIDCGEGSLLAVQIPAGWDAAGLALEASTTAGGTYGPVSAKDGTPYAVAVAAGEVVALDLEVTRPFRFLKLVSGTSAAPVNQTVARAVNAIIG